MKSNQLATAIFLIVSTLSLQNAVAQQTDQNANDAEVAVFSLQNAQAFDVANSVNKAMEGFSAARAIADSNSNSVIVSGHASEVQQMADLIKSLDVPARSGVGEAGKSEFRVFSLVHCDAEAALDVVSTLFAGTRGMQLDVDRQANSLYVKGLPDDLDVMQDVLEKLDAEVGEASSETRHNSVYVSLTLVVETTGMSAEAQAELKPLDTATSSLLATAAGRGLLSFVNPMVVTRAVTHVRCDTPDGDPQDENQRQGGRFENVSEAASAGYRVVQNGNLQRLDNGDFLLDTSITISVTDLEPVAEGSGGGGFGGDGGSSRRVSKSQINSEIVVRLDHPVLLSFSAVNNVDSALIVKLVEAD
ncbi:MAG: secretin N-terminal domain-containing protein [Pirellulaceae bacterium]